MGTVSIEFAEQPVTIRPFTPDKAEVHFTLSLNSAGPYWVECLVESPRQLSLAPQRELDRARMMIGILNKGESKNKDLRVFSSNATYPDTYNIKFTFLIYDRDGVIAERVDYKHDIVCRVADVNAKVL